MQRARSMMQNLPFGRKILLLILLAGVVPLAVLSAYSLHAVQRSTEAQQLHLVNNSYEQVLISLEEKLGRVHNISTLLAVNETINMTLSLDARDPGNVLEQLADFESVSSYTQAVEMSLSGSSVYYYINDAFVVAQDLSNRYRPLSSVVDTHWGRSVQANLGRPTWVSPEGLGRLPDDGEPLALARYLWDHNDYAKSLGILLLTVDSQQLQGMMVSALPGQRIGILSSQGELLTAGAQGAFALPDPLRPSAVDGFTPLSFEGASYLYRLSPIANTDLYLFSMLPQALITEQVRHTLGRMLLLYALVFVAMAALVVPLTRSITRRIALLDRQISSTGAAGLQKLHTPQHGDEIGRLIEAYNAMVDEMHALLQTQYDLGRAKAGAELSALQSQINPHFLYNTLDMVSWMAQRGEGENIQAVMQALSQFYKLTLSRGKDIITLGEEIHLCEAYMRIQQLRTKGSIALRVDVEPQLLCARLPKITLQPMVENAILHGITPRNPPVGTLIISGMEEERGGARTMLLSVVDDGVGMASGAAEKPSGGSRYGLRNIEKRLSLFFEQDIAIQVESAPDLGTCVSFAAPVWPEDETEGGGMDA